MISDYADGICPHLLVAWHNTEKREEMFDMQSYEYVRRANEERVERALRRYLARHHADESRVITEADTEVIDVVFRTGCHYDELTA